MNGRPKQLLFIIGLALLLTLGQVFSVLAQGPQPAEGTPRQVDPGQTPAGLTTAEWRGIESQITADRYRPRADEAGGYLSANLAHGWRIGYGADGTTTLAGNGDWAWGLRLTGYGYQDQSGFQNLTGVTPILTAAKATLTYQWDANISEWWINTPAGLEQGFTVQQRPDDVATGPLVVDMAVKGDLTPMLRGDGIAFTDSSNATILTYNKLHVTDAAGQVIPARFAVMGQTLQILVDDQQATYPLTIDPLVQQAYLKAPYADADDYFGYSVAIDGDTMVVGAFREDSALGAGEDDNNAIDSGAAYIFTLVDGSWNKQAFLKASNAEGGDEFGYAVDISGDTVVVSAHYEAGDGSSEDNNDHGNAGAAYIFTRSGETWSQQAYLKASNTATADQFGDSVAIDGDTVIVGAPQEDSDGSGEDNNDAGAAGAAYVFTRSGETWTQQAYLKADNAAAGDMFGDAVAVSGGTVVVGAPGQSTDGPPDENWLNNAGAAYVFTRTAESSWGQEAYLKAATPEQNQSFGWAVAVDGDTAVVGTTGDESVTIFARSGETWSQQAYLRAANYHAYSGDSFGWSLAIDGDTLVVGANGEASSATGGEDDNSASGAGAAYVFTRNGTDWHQKAYLKAANAEGGSPFGDSFGSVVALSNDFVVAGAWKEDSDGSGADDNSAEDAGAVYAFPTLSLSKRVQPVSDVPYHGVVSYTLTLNNIGSADANNVLLTDTLPTDVDFADWLEQSAAVVSNDEITWNGTVTAGNAITISFEATNNGPGDTVVTNTAQFSGAVYTGSAQAVYTATNQCVVATSGNWSAEAANCPAAHAIIIPAGITVTLDSDIDLDVDLTVESGGSLDATTLNHTLTLTGSGDQSLTGDFTFYRLTVNKDNTTDSVTINGSLNVTDKLRVSNGELVSASQYEDVDIEAGGTLSQTNVISISGNLAITGTLETNGWGVSFNGAKAQNLALYTGTSFDDITVITGTTLIETEITDGVTAVGRITNYGTIRKNRPIAATGTATFGLAGIYPDADAGGLKIEITDRTGGDPLSEIQVDRIDTAHPNAPDEANGNGNGIYWGITPTGSDYTATVTLPYTNVTSPLACRYTGTGSDWDCAGDSSTTNTVTYSDTTTFSDWAVFANQVVAIDDFTTIDEDTTVTLSPLGNDSSLNSSAGLTIGSVGTPSQGTATISGTNQIVYQPNLNTNGSDSFTYAATGSDGLTDTATISITINPVNDAPYAVEKVPSGWAPVGGNYFSSGSTSVIDLAFASDDTLYVAYSDGTNDDKVSVMKFNGTAWEQVGSAGFSAGNAYHLDLDIDSDDTLYVAYRDGGNDYKASVMKFNGSSWEQVGSAGFSDHDAQQFSLVLDSNDTPYLAYFDFYVDSGALTKEANVKKFNGTTWEQVGSANFLGNDFNWLRLVLDGNDTPYVAYRDGANDDKASVMKFNGTAWEQVGSAGFTAGAANYVALGIDGDDTLYVGYQDTANGAKASVMKYSVISDTWEYVGSAGFSKWQTPYLNLAFTSDDTPYVAYMDILNDSQASVLKFNGTTWEYVGSAGFSSTDEGKAYDLSLAIDSTDTPYVGFRDYDDPKRGSVMMAIDERSTDILNVTMSEDGSPTPFDLTITVKEVEDDPVTWSLTTQALTGTAAISTGNNLTRTITYTTPKDWFGRDIFTVTVSDGSISGTVAVSVTVESVNDKPVTVADVVTTTKNMEITVSPLTNDSDVDGPLPLYLDDISTPPHGTASLISSPSVSSTQLIYTPTTNFTGFDALVYTAGDGDDTVTNTVDIWIGLCTPSATSGNWSVVFSHCEAGEVIGIPSGYTVTLNSDLNLDVDLEIQRGGTLDTNGKTVTFSGSGDQTLKGAFEFYNLTVNKDATSDSVIFDGSLTVKRKTNILQGKLVSASQYEDIDIDTNGSLVLTNTIGISGNLVISGTLTTNGWGISFNGGHEQNLTLNTATGFDDITITAGTTLIETVADDNISGVGVITNSGTIRKTQAMAGPEFYYFGLAGLYPDPGAYGLEIEVTDLSGGDPLTKLQVDRIDQTHPNAPGAGDSIYWTITPTGSDYTATVTLPYTGVTNPLACRYTGSDNDWDCANDDSDVDYVSYYTVTTFSDWAVFANQVTAVDDPSESTNEDTAVTISPLTNDSILDSSGSITIASVGFPAHGTAVISGTTQVVYTPTLDYNGTDSFTYTAQAGVLTGTGTISVTVNPVNDAPQVIGGVSYLTKWGSNGSGDGQFSSPYGVGVDSNGYVYVADRSNNRIQKFSSSGAYISQWGSDGSGDGQFSSPYGVAIDSSGNVYVADTNNHRIQKFDSNGVYISQWGSNGSGDGQFSSPYGVGVDSSGNVYVTDTNNRRIQKFDSNGNFVAAWGWGVNDGTAEFQICTSSSTPCQAGIDGTGDGQFYSPRGVAMDSSGNVYVTDYLNNRIQKFSSSGAYISQWGSNGSGDGQFNWPYGVGVDSSGNVYVTDTNNDRIQKFTGDGAYDSQWGESGTGDGQFDSLTGIAIDSSGNVYVADTNNDRIQKFSLVSLISQTTVTMSEDGNPTPFDLTLTAEDPDTGDTHTWSVVTQAVTGTAAISASDGLTATITYTPQANWFGSDVFTVAVSDGTISDTVAVNVTVQPVNDAPVAVDDTITTTEDVTVTITALNNDSDIDSDIITATAVSWPANGAAVISGSTQVVYTPDLNWYGTDSFTYTASDGTLTDTAIITVNVTPVNDEPRIVQWAQVGSAGFSADSTTYTSLAIAGSGTPYVAYQDGANGTKASVMKYNGSSWVQVGSPGFSTYQANYISLAIDGNGTPYAAYSEGNASVMKYNGSSWEQVGSAGFSAGGAYYTSLAFDSNGTPYVAYQDRSIASNNKASVMKFNGSSWVQVGSAGFSAGSAYYTSLAFDNSDTPYVAYKDGANDDKASVMKFNGSSWVQVGSAGFSAGRTSYTSLAIDGSGTPYVAYQDGVTGPASVMKFNGSSWEQVGSAGFSAGRAESTSLAIDGSDTPYVAYGDGFSSKTSVMKFNGSSWEQVGNAGFSAGGAGFISLAIDGSDTPYVAYKDVANGGKASVMKFNGNNDHLSATMSEDGSPTQFDPNITVKDPDTGDTLTWSLVTQAISGTASVSGTGIDPTIAYTPIANWFGTDVFTLSVTDGALTDTASVSVTVESVNDAPTATDDTASTLKNTAVTISPLLNDTDVESSTLSISVVGKPISGTATISGTTQIDFTPATDYSGFDVFTYTASDGTLTDTATITVAVDICTPSATTGNWSDVFDQCLGGSKIVIPAGYTVTLDQNISLSSDLEIEAGGSLDATSQRRTLTLTGSGDQTLTGDLTFYRLTVDKDNSADTVTIDGSLTVKSKMRVRKGKLFSASDYEDVEIEASGTLSLTNVISVSGHFTNAGSLQTNGWGIVFDGAITQNLVLSTSTTFDDITVLTGTILIETNGDDNVAGVGTITNYGTIRKSQTVDAADSYYFGLAGLYPDYSAYGLEIEITDLSGGDPLTAIQVDRIDAVHPNAPGKGNDLYWLISPTGSNYTATVTLPYTDVTNPLACRYTGTDNDWDCANDDSAADPDWYVSQNDVTTFSDWAVFANQVTAVDDPSESTNEDTAVTISPLGNDVSLAGSGSITIASVGFPAHGTAVISGTTQVVYTPTLDYNGTDSFTYTAADGSLSDTATISVTVNAVNDAPVITDSTPISVTMSEDGSPTVFDLTLHAEDPDSGDTLTWSIATQAISGTATANGMGITQTIGYSPPANWFGTTVFTVAVSDGAISDTATVSVTVQPVNDAPTALDDTALVMRNDTGDLTLLSTTPVTIPVLVNDTDLDSGNNIGLTVSAVGNPSQGGSAVPNANGKLVDYTPTAAFTGTETFTYTVSDGGGLQDTATVTVTVVNGDGGGSTTPDENSGETIVIPDTGISGTITVTVQIPAGVATDTLALVYNEIVTPTETVPDGFVLAGLVFTLDAYINQALQPGYVFSTPITLTLEYSDDDVADIPQGEGSLALYYWDSDEGEWSSDGITVVERDTDNNRLVVTINHLTEFALFGKDIALYYFPIIVKNYVVAPDLVITDLSGDSSGITVKLENQGNSTVVKDFWVDVYFNPTEIPTLNQPWNSIASQGATWGVTANVGAGDSLTLTSGGAYYRADLSSGSFPDGATVYGYVDSVNFGSTYGNVWESNEANNLWPTNSGSAGVQAAGGKGATTSGLPGR